MTLISIQNIRMAFGGPMLLEDLSLDVLKGQRICILGRNGAGKSTLLKIMNRELIPDAGDVIYAPSLHVAHLAQDVPETKDGTTFDVVAGGAGPAGVALAAYYHELALGTNPDRLHDAQHDCTTLDGWKLESIINRVLTQVQVPADVPFASLSGGMRRRVFLARALVQEPDILLLDEPTNHLDLESIAWLESFLIASRLTVVFVTHDRRFLRKLATRIVEIDRGKVVDWSCDYPTFLERKQAALEVEAKEWAQFDKKLAQEEVWIRQGVRARRTRNEGRVRALKKMREERKRRRERVGNVSMSVNLSERSGDRVLEAENVTFGYGATPLLKDFSFTLNRGDRVGILGPNGCGKTTLLNLLLGKLKPQQGVVELGAQVSPLYFDQLREGIDLEKTVWENVAPPGGDTVVINGVSRHVISYLLDFLFTADRARTPVKALSGGERHRLLLARLFTFPANLLIFDEPTNDLDAETMELLEELLLDYPGTLIVVSHDREFLNNVVTSALIFDKNLMVNEFVGGYDDWERQLAALATAATEPPKPRMAAPVEKPASPAPTGGVRKLSFKEKKELETLPTLIESLDTEQEQLHIQLADFVQCQKPGFVAQGKARLAEIETKLKLAFERWEELDKIFRAGS